MAETIFTKDKAARTLTMQRIFNAPREKVFAAFSNVDALNAWWGPQGWETRSKEFSFTPGGAWHYGMKCVDEAQGEWFGQEAWGKAVYETIDEQHTIVYRDYFADADGTIDESMPGSTISMNFVDLGDGRTELISITQFDSEEGYDQVIAMGVEQGASESWDRLAEYMSES
jgi:uncharacterized protein YndB with AHSA1/START domain